MRSARKCFVTMLDTPVLRRFVWPLGAPGLATERFEGRDALTGRGFEPRAQGQLAKQGAMARLRYGL